MRPRLARAVAKVLQDERLAHEVLIGPHQPVEDVGALGARVGLALGQRVAEVVQLLARVDAVAGRLEIEAPRREDLEELGEAAVRVGDRERLAPAQRRRELAERRARRAVRQSAAQRLELRVGLGVNRLEARERALEMRRAVDGARALRAQQQVQAVARRDALAWALERRPQPKYRENAPQHYGMPCCTH